MGDYYCAGSLDTHVVFGIFVASLRAVGCATTLASAGLWLARQGVMTPALSKGLSQLSVKLAIPCLLFSSVVPGVSWHVLSYAWPLLLLPAVHLLLGVLLGCLTAFIVKPPERFRLGTVAACAFGNTTGIPIVLLSVLQQSLGRAVFAELADPLLFLSLQLLTYPLLQWTLGLALMWFNRKFGRSSSALDHYPASPALNSDPMVSAFAEDDEGGVLPTVLRPKPSGGDDERPSFYRPPGSCEAEPEAKADPEGLLRYTGAVPLRHARRCATAASSSYIPMMSEAEDEASVQFARQFAGQTAWDSASERLHALGTLVQTFSSRDNAVRLCQRAGVLLQQLLVPPVVGVGLGALVGMLGRGLVLPPEVAPLGWLFMAVSKLGAAAVPINLILLGAALSQGPLRGELPRLNSFGVVLARLVLMPLCGLAVARFLAARINVPAEVADPFWLVCLIVTCTPTGNNIVVLCELAGDNKHACSTTIFYQYMAAPLLLPFILTMFVGFICRTREDSEGHQGLTLEDPASLW